MNEEIRFEPLPPIVVASLLRKVDGLLVELLRSLSADEWNRTATPRWTVHDVAAHLLDTQVRKLSVVRDKHFPQPAPEIRSQTELVDFINRLNAQGVAYFRRLSPEVLIKLIETTSEESAAFHESLDAMADAMFTVSWAGEQVSKNWFDTARELTERWHHQQQIREAVEKPGIMTRELYHPVLDCFLRGLPYHFREVVRPEGAALRVRIEGDCGGTWSLMRTRCDWTLTTTELEKPSAEITIRQEIAWKVFTKGMERAKARAVCAISGDEELAAHLLTMTAIVG
jgi:uncharacterized protein (TIGR03083 family)